MMSFIEKQLLNFEIFGFLHITMILFTIVVIYLIYRYQDKIRNWKHHDRGMRYIIAISMFTVMALYYLDLIIKGTWNYKSDLPLHFCFIGGYLFMYSLITNKKDMFKYLYFFAFAGPLPAIIIPDIKTGINTIVMWQYFFSHYVFLIGAFYTFYVLKWEVTMKDSLKALTLGHIILLLVFLFNQIFGSNYIMTTRLPDIVIRLFPFTKYIDFPILWLEIAAIIAFGIACIPVYANSKGIKLKAGLIH